MSEKRTQRSAITPERNPFGMMVIAFSLGLELRLFSTNQHQVPTKGQKFLRTKIFLKGFPAISPTGWHKAKEILRKPTCGSNGFRIQMTTSLMRCFAFLLESSSITSTACVWFRRVMGNIVELGFAAGILDMWMWV